MKQKNKYPLAYRLDDQTIIVWLSPTKCYQVKQLEIFDLS